jgi:hypothetical protein
MLAGIFRLADELECISMRMKLHGAKADDPRNAISGVRIDAEGKKIFLAFHRDTTPTKQSVCKHYLGNALLSVRTLLKPHGLSYRQTQTLSPSVEQGASSREEKAAYVKAQSYDIPAASNEEGQGSSKAPIRDIEKVLGRIQYHRLATIRTTALLGLVRRV